MTKELFEPWFGEVFFDGTDTIIEEIIETVRSDREE